MKLASAVLVITTFAWVTVAQVQVRQSKSSLGTRQENKKFWYEDVLHNGVSPVGEWSVFRNVKEYGAKGDGITDDTAAIQRAISEGTASGDRISGTFGSTGQPAVVYFPAGIYLVTSTIRSAVGTVLMGNPLDRAVLKASKTFSGTFLLYGHDQRYSGLVGFFHGVKSLVLDSTDVPGETTLGLLEWSVSQNNLLSNVAFRMPLGASGHGGVWMQGLNSGLMMNDLEFSGGSVGITIAATQYHLKNIFFKGQLSYVESNGDPF